MTSDAICGEEQGVSNNRVLDDGWDEEESGISRGCVCVVGQARRHLAQADR